MRGCSVIGPWWVVCFLVLLWLFLACVNKPGCLAVPDRRTDRFCWWNLGGICFSLAGILPSNREIQNSTVRRSSSLHFCYFDLWRRCQEGGSVLVLFSGQGEVDYLKFCSGGGWKLVTLWTKTVRRETSRCSRLPFPCTSCRNTGQWDCMKCHFCSDNSKLNLA
jgi:hypothetical protein